MNRKLSALGLALIAALALSAVAAASASAVNHKFKVGSNPTHLTAAAEPGEAGHQVFEATTGEHKASICTKVEIETGTGTVEALSTEEVTVGPKYGDCGIYQTIKNPPKECEEPGAKGTETECTEKLAASQVNTTGCHYRFFGATTGENPTNDGEHANVAIENGGGCTSIDITVTALKLKCISIPSGQTIKHAVRYENQETESGTWDVTVKATAHGIENITTDSVACPTKTGEDEPHGNGSYTGAISLTGYEDEAHTKPTNVTVE